MDGAKIVVVGLGDSGRAATRLALEKGGRVHATDIETDAETTAAGDELRTMGARVELGRHSVDEFSGAAAVVVSPGIPPDAPVLRELRRREISWISELEFAFRFIDGPLIAVTGTNGKTTTALMTTRILREAGFRVGVGGNVGAGLGPAASELALAAPAADRYVLEASSFQLADIEWFRPDVGVVTNLEPDHLDRYPDAAAYYADKKRIFENADEECDWVLNSADPDVIELAGDAPGRRHHFHAAGGSSSPVSSGDGGGFAYATDDRLLFRWPEGSATKEISVPRRDLRLLGRHNVANALAAGLAAAMSGADGAALERGIRSFDPLPHRLEPVGEVDGVLWINDSKATNVGATASAVESLDRPLVVLLGGKDKGEDYARLSTALKRTNVQRVVAYGAARDRIADSLEGAVAVERVEGGFDDAVAAGREAARRGDILLLSPACSSYDMFESYEERGRRFRELASGSTMDDGR